MRWSLILPVFIGVLSMQSLLSFALVTTQREAALEKRVFGLGKKKDVKASSSTYRSNSFSHPYSYEFGPNGVTRQSVPENKRQGVFSKMFKNKKFDADHIYETQLYHDTLRRQGTSHAQLPPALQEETRRIMNGPGNVAPIQPDVNKRKGQWVKQGRQGKAPRRGHELTRSYSLSSYPQARETSHQLQNALQQHGLGQQGPTFHQNLHDTMMHAGVLTPGQPSPNNSPPRHSHSVSHHNTGSQPVIPQMHRSQSTRPSSRRQRAPSVSGPPPVIPQVHRSQSTRQRTSSMSSQMPMYQHPQGSSMTIHQQYAHATGQYVQQQPMYQNPHAHASTSYIQQQPVYQNPYAHASTSYVSQPQAHYPSGHYPSSHASSSRSPYHPY